MLLDHPLLSPQLNPSHLTSPHLTSYECQELWWWREEVERMVWEGLRSGVSGTLLTSCGWEWSSRVSYGGSTAGEDWEMWFQSGHLLLDLPLTSAHPASAHRLHLTALHITAFEWQGVWLGLESRGKVSGVGEYEGWNEKCVCVFFGWSGGIESHIVGYGGVWRIRGVRGWQVLLDAAKGMLFLHEFTPPLTHFDIKPHNILVSAGSSSSPSSHLPLITITPRIDLILITSLSIPPYITVTRRPYLLFT